MINKLERKFGRYAIRGLMKYIMILYALGFVILLIDKDFYGVWLRYDVDKVFLQGQVWRLFTFLIQPIDSESVFITLINMYLFYFIGTMLEMRWGSFRFNLFYFSGALFHILSATIVYFIVRSVIGFGITPVIGLDYINLAMLFAFATEFGDVEFLLFFMIPLKVKYLGFFYAGLYGYQFAKLFVTQGVNVSSVIVCIPFAVGLLHFVIYFIASRRARMMRRRTIRDLRRQFEYRSNVASGMRDGAVVNTVGNRKVITKHRCAVCGRTELDDDSLEFRFCSKCEGDYEYCMDHLYTHTHVKREPAGGDHEH